MIERRDSRGYTETELKTGRESGREEWARVEGEREAATSRGRTRTLKAQEQGLEIRLLSSRRKQGPLKDVCWKGEVGPGERKVRVGRMCVQKRREQKWQSEVVGRP